MRERGEREALAPALEKPPREPDRVDDRRRDAPAGEPLDLALEEREVEARVVRDERRVAREAEEAADGQLRARRPPQVGVADPGERGDVGRERRARVDERLERVLDRERADAHRADLADAAAARGEPGRLEVEDDELGVLDQDVGVRRVGEPDARAEPGEPRVALDDVLEQRAGERSRRPLEREEHVRRVVRSDRPAPSLHELDEPIRSIERELHARRLSNICSYLKRCEQSRRTSARTTEGPPRGGPSETSEDALG